MFLTKRKKAHSPILQKFPASLFQLPRRSEAAWEHGHFSFDLDLRSWPFLFKNLSCVLQWLPSSLAFDGSWCCDCRFFVWASWVFAERQERGRALWSRAPGCTQSAPGTGRRTAGSAPCPPARSRPDGHTAGTCSDTTRHPPAVPKTVFPPFLAKVMLHHKKRNPSWLWTADSKSLLFLPFWH